MLIIDKDTTRRLLSISEALPALVESFKAISLGPNQVIRAFVNEPEHQDRGLLLGGYMGSSQGICFKLVGQFGPKYSGFIVAVDTKTGNPEVMVSGSYVTNLRTGAASGVATDVLARQESSRLAIIGTGRQATTQLLAMIEVRSITEVLVWNRTRSRAETWIKQMRNKIGEDSPSFYLMKNPADACKNVDIVVISTSAEEPILQAEWLSPGTHINAVGSGAEFQRELDVSVLQIASIRAVDNIEMALRVGDFIEPLKKGLIHSEQYIEIGEILLGRAEGRINDNQITLFKSVGHPANDLAIARVLVKLARKSGEGIEVPFTTNDE